MSIAAGSRFGPYEVVAPIGAGGMGEVFKARDTRLERSVAIKVLPAEFAHDAQFKVRFEREAKTISQLNHPHICTLYDVGDGYLVMELLEGETLADRLTHGAMSTEEVLRYGIEIAEALDKAHRQGIVHRDLKPGNIMLTKSGSKLLDFGLAKGGALLPSAVDLTQHKPLTQEGTILGTFQYMAPEQLEGLEADGRTDIFALGALLYEMATGRRAFDGKTKTSLIAAIVSGRPTPVSQVQPLAPPALEHVIERCLEKDAGDRWQSARDVAEELKWIRAKGSQAGIAAPILSRRKTRERLWWFLTPALMIAAAAATWQVIELRREPPHVIRSTILPPPKTQLISSGGAPALSPNRKLLVFAALSTGTTSSVLFVRPLSGTTAQPLTGTEDGHLSFWSPDSRSICFFARGKLMRIDASGGPAQTLGTVTGGRGGSWSPNGTIIFAPTPSSNILKVSDSGGIATAATEVDFAAGETSHRYPSFLPDGRHFLYTVQKRVSRRDEGSAICVGSIDDKKFKKNLLLAESNAVYSSGYLLYWRDGSLVSQQFDPKSLTVGRDIIPVAEDLARTSSGDALFSTSNDGTLILETGAANDVSQLVWVDASGKKIEELGKPAEYRALRPSHDGRRVALAILDPATDHTDLWIMDIARRTATRLTFDPGDENAPRWSPDDSQIVYFSNAKTAGDLLVKRTSGTGTEEVIYSNNFFKIPTDWSPDGKTIFFQQQIPGKSGWDLWTFSLVDRKAQVFLQTPFDEGNALWSPDGRWVLYHSNESGKQEIYVVPADGKGGKWQISTDGGTRPRWSSDGKEIYYIVPRELKLMAVGVATQGNEFIAGTPRPLFSLENTPRNNATPYEVANDGKRFLVNTVPEQREIAPLTLIQNWTSALKK